MKESHVEVLVVGAGPTGLFTAGELARHGVISRVIEKEPTRHRQTRATEIQPAVLEVFQRAGLAEAILASSLPMRGLRVLDARREEAFLSPIPPADSPFPHTRSLAQWQTEDILCQRLEDLGVVVERGVEAGEITVRDDGVRVECTDSEGRPFVIHADYLVGAGGAHSTCRGAIHERLCGVTYPRRYLVADVAASGVHDHRNLISVAISPQGMVMIIELPGGRSLVLTDLPEDFDVDAPPGLEDVQKAINLHLENPFSISDLQWSSVYRMHRRMSPRFSQGRCFLAGDAAHISSPLGGEGLNCGVLDGASLAWMIAAVIRRGGKPLLLEAYEPERQEIARQVLASSDVMHGYYALLVDMAVARSPLVDPPEDPTRKVMSNSMVDLRLIDSPILGSHGAILGVHKVRPGSRFPEVAKLQGTGHHLLVWGSEAWSRGEFSWRWNRVFAIGRGEDICTAERAGVSPSGALLVRPDGYVGFLAEKWSAEARETLDTFLLRQFEPSEPV